MKKIKIVFPALILLCAGMSMTGCPSEPTPIKPIEDFNLVFEGGKYQLVFDTPRIEHGKEYEVILTIENCDEDFIGSYLGGKICYKDSMDDNDEKILSGWLNSSPNKVSKSIKTYKWTFTAGADNGEDRLHAVNPATTPDGAVQYFSLTAQDSSWKNYDSSRNFRIKGGFEIKFKETITVWTSEGIIELNNVDDTAGKGELSSEAMDAIRAMPAGSKIVLTVIVEVMEEPDEPRGGWGIGTVGADWSSGIDINVPSDAAAGPLTFTVEIDIADLLALVGNGNIIINIWSCTITQAELFKPGN